MGLWDQSQRRRQKQVSYVNTGITAPLCLVLIRWRHVTTVLSEMSNQSIAQSSSSIVVVLCSRVEWSIVRATRVTTVCSWASTGPSLDTTQNSPVERHVPRPRCDRGQRSLTTAHARCELAGFHLHAAVRRHTAARSTCDGSRRESCRSSSSRRLGCSSSESSPASDTWSRLSECACQSHQHRYISRRGGVSTGTPEPTSDKTLFY